MKASTPKGTRDFLPDQAFKRQYIFDILRDIFERFGYQPIETPAMENLKTLTGKYGEEGDRLIFKVLNNGDYLSKADEGALKDRDSNRLTPSIARRALRYDLTIPFARFVVMNQNEIQFPFKRYQIQPVWRADRPQKGRYQEFYQCDVDVVGSDSLMYEAELLQIYDQAFERLGIPVVIRMNNRKLLAGIAAVSGISSKLVEMTAAIDKLDKTSWSKVRKEMSSRGIDDAAGNKIEDLLKSGQLEDLESALADSEIGKQGIAEIRKVQEYLSAYSFHNILKIDPTLARGLDYYTGCIFEVEIEPQAFPTVKMGSLGGGGRYDDLTGIFGMKNVSGIGVSFGAERIFDFMEEQQLFPVENIGGLQLLFVAFDEETHRYAFTLLQQVRDAGIRADLYPDPVKMGKQMGYADKRQIKHVAIIGSDEMQSQRVMLKNMASGEQESLRLAEVINRLQTP